MKSWRIDIDFARSDEWGFGFAIVPVDGGVLSLGRWYIEVNWRKV